MDGRSPRPASTTRSHVGCRIRHIWEATVQTRGAKTVAGAKNGGRRAASRMEPKMHVATTREQPSSRSPDFPGGHFIALRAEKRAGVPQPPCLGHASGTACCEIGPVFGLGR